MNDGPPSGKSPATFCLRIATPFLFVLFAVSGAQVRAQESATETRTSPDGSHFIGWFDHDAGKPIGFVRSIVCRADSTSDAPIYSFVGFSRYTDAVWNAASTRCVIVNELDWENTAILLVTKYPSGHWHSRELQPLAPVKAAYQRAIGDKDHPGFRVHVDKMEWLSATEVRFLVWSNANDPDLASSGRYWVTLDTQSPESVPKMTKLKSGEAPTD